MRCIRSNISDTLCSLSTGGGFLTRKLYTDDEVHIFDQCRAYIINGLENVAPRPDLMDRSIALNLPTMPLGARRKEQAMNDQFAELHPRILGKLFEIVACALSGEQDPEFTADIRMADAAEWLLAAEPATDRTCSS